MKRLIVLLVLLGIGLLSCKQNSKSRTIDEFSKNQLTTYNRKLTQVIITDIFTPPVCSRIYAYVNIAAYEAMRFGNEKYPSYAGRLHELMSLPSPGKNEDYYFPVSGMMAFFTVAQKLVFNKEAVMALETEYLNDLKNVNADDEKIDRSIAFGRKVGTHIIEWAVKDGYLQRTSLPGYIVNKQVGRWQPTPPDYMDAIEPNWRTIRTFVLDSASQFMPPAPSEFDTTVNSDFYKNAMEVHDAVKMLEPKQTDMAKFWDCNPNISVTQGHVMYFQQKISPGGHWMHITCSIAEKENYDQIKTAEVLSKVAITIADAFISCWQAKYNYNLIRPETYINRYIDKEWKPLLQTPAFPEYPSGHSVASAGAATMLTKLVGDNYNYKDSSEVPFGLPMREYKSFIEAMEEASLSRLYGGIHYMPAIKNGMEEGKKIGNFIISKLN